MISFDVFDTLITRSTAVPEGIFTIMQEVLIKNNELYGVDNNFAENFYYQRAGSEQFARTHWRGKGAEEVTLVQIYDAMAAGGKVNNEQADKIRRLELQVEYDNILPVKRNIQKVKDFMALGERVILISDMYLSADEIRHLLCKADSIFKSIPIYVSSEYKKTKKSGGLYQEISKLENIKFGEWTHYGDNGFSDVEIPLSLGISTVKVSVRKLMPYEKILLSKYGQDALVQSMTGVAEYLDEQCGGNQYEVVGNSYGGPIIYSYVSWILETSLKQNISRLYFIARDGWILKRTADIIIDSRKMSIRTYYIYGSRKAWRLASISKKNCNFKKVLTNSGMGIWNSVDDLLDLLQISKEELIDLLPYGYRHVLTEDTGHFLYYLQDIIQYIIKDPDWKEFLLDKNEENSQLVRDYIRENIDLTDEHFAFVELSGTGYTQVCLAGIIEQIKKCNVRSFFLTMDEIWNEENCSFYVFFPNSISNRYVVELLCRAPHGQTEGYKRENGKVVPVLEENEGRYIIKTGYMNYVQGVLAFVKQFEKVNVRNNISVNVKLINSYLEYAAEDTGTEIRLFFSNMPFSTCGVQDGQTYAPPLTLKQLRTWFFWGEIPGDYQGASLEFALTHLIREHIKIRDYYIWLRNTAFGKWCVRKRYNYVNGLYGQQRYFYPKGSLKGKIILYAAGKVGWDYYKQIKKDKNLELVAWTDSNYGNMQEDQRKLLISPDRIKDYDYDFILIAVAGQELLLKIKGYLLEMGVDKKQIMWICPLIKR